MTDKSDIRLNLHVSLINGIESYRYWEISEWGNPYKYGFSLSSLEDLVKLGELIQQAIEKEMDKKGE